MLYNNVKNKLLSFLPGKKILLVTILFREKLSNENANNGNFPFPYFFSFTLIEPKKTTKELIAYTSAEAVCLKRFDHRETIKKQIIDITKSFFRDNGTDIEFIFNSKIARLYMMWCVELEDKKSTSESSERGFEQRIWESVSIEKELDVYSNNAINLIRYEWLKIRLLHQKEPKEKVEYLTSIFEKYSRDNFTEFIRKIIKNYDVDELRFVAENIIYLEPTYISILDACNIRFKSKFDKDRKAVSLLLI